MGSILKIPMKILLVDDDTEFLEQAKLFLEMNDSSFNVTVCETASNALGKLEDDNFDIIVSDYMMPVMGGLVFLKKIREKGDDIPFIIFTGKGREEVAMDALNLGADRYLQKGGDPKAQYGVLSKEIRQEVDRYRIRKKLREQEEMYKLVTESFYDMITLVDIKKNTIILVSNAVEDLLGYDPEELIGRIFFDILHPEDKDEVYEKLTELIASGDTEGMFNDRVLCKDGGYKWIENRFRILADENSQPDKLLIVARDMTKHGVVTSELSSMAKKYRNIFESAWTAILVVEEDTTISMVNKRFEEITGYSREYIESGISWTEFVHQDDLERMFEYHIKRREDPSSVPNEYEARLIDSHGDIKNVLLSVELIEGTGKSVATLLDITELHSLKDISRGLMDSDHIGVMIVQDGVIKEISPGVMHVLGYPKIEIIDKDPLKFVPDEEREEFHRIHQTTLNRGQNGYKKHSLKHMDGSLRWVMDEISLIRYHGKKAAMLIFIDISYDTEVRRALERSEQEHRAMVESAFAGISISDLDDNINFANETFANMLGYTRAELNDMNAKQLFQKNSLNIAKEMTDVRKRGISNVYETELIRKDGNLINVLIQATPLFDETSVVTGTLAVISDITEFKKIQEREKFLSSLLRHDIANKMNLTRGYIELLEETPLNEEGKRYLERAMHSVDEGVKLIDKIGKLRHIYTDPQYYQNISLGKVMEHVIDQVKGELMNRNINLIADYEDAIVVAGPLLEELFFNLISNAIDHSGCNTIRLSIEDHEESVTVIIEDDGEGIPSELEENIFKRGVKGTHSKGMGLGLYLVEGIAKSYGGHVKLQRSSMGGSRFEVILKKS